MKIAPRSQIRSTNTRDAAAGYSSSPAWCLSCDPGSGRGNSRRVHHAGADDAVTPMTRPPRQPRSGCPIHHGPRAIPRRGSPSNMRLRRSTVRGPGIRRVRRGRGFSYQNSDGSPVTDKESAATYPRPRDSTRVEKVWICSYPNRAHPGVGTDAAGRLQYLYHQTWQEDRNEEKFDRVLEMSAALPDMRRRIAADLRRRGLERDRVLALALHPARSRLLPCWQRAIRRGEQLVRHRHAAV